MKEQNERFDDILEECLEGLRRGQTVEQCLQKHPGQAEELRPLLLTAQTVKEASAISPRPEFRARVRYELCRAMEQAARKKERHPFFLIWQRGWAVACAVVLSLLLAGSGTVLAASSSMPDETLYPVKIATEEIQVRLAASDLDKAELYARLAEKRVDEIARMAEEGKADSVEWAAERLDGHLVMVVKLLPAKAAQEATMMAPSIAPAPAPAPTTTPAPTRTPTATPRPTPAPTPRPTPSPAPAAPRGATPAPSVATRDSAAGVKSAKDAQVKKVVTENAAKQLPALRAALEKAPEAAKPAIRQAIARAVAGYEKALKALDD